MSADFCGLDLSLTGTGIACADHVDVLKPPKGCSGESRLDWIRSEILEHLPGTTYTLVVIEGYSYASPHGAHQLGELGGLIRWTLWNRGTPFVEIPPATLKKFATGKGNAPKDGMLSAAVRNGYDGSDNNGADAWWLRQMGVGAYQIPPVGTPAYRLEAMERITWPALLEVAS